MRFYNVQKKAIKRGMTGENLGLFFEPGTGKTVVPLEILRQHKNAGRKKKMLVVTTLRICYLTWPNELKAWGNRYRRLDYTIMHGPLKQRNMNKDKDIHLINIEGLKILLQHYKGKRWPYDILVIDESTKFKNYASVCHKIIRAKYHTFEQIILLTGTPSPEGLEDLYAQLWLLDKGKRLGHTKKAFHERFFSKFLMQYGAGRPFYEWTPLPDAERRIKKRISDIVMVAKTEDYVDLPKVVHNEVMFDLCEKTQDYYDEMEQEMAVWLREQEDYLLAESAGAKYAKLRQISSGFAYDEDGETIPFSNEKMDTLKELLAEINAPTIVMYKFVPELEQIKKEIKGATTLDAKGGIRHMQKVQDKWNAGKIPVLVLYPGASAHGLNIDKSCQHMIWYSLTDSGEDFMQMIRRLERKGNVGKTVFVHYLLASRTIDKPIVYNRIREKQTKQEKFLRSLKNYMRLKR